MHHHPIVGIAAAIALSAAATLAQDQTFNVYGFADGRISKSSLEKNNFLMPFAGEDQLSFGLAHFNIYFDWKPSEKTRALLELATMNKNTLGGGFPNRQIITRILGIEALPAQVQAGLAAQGVSSYRADTVVMGATLGEIWAPNVERAYFDLLIHPMANLRLGQFITPAGIWNVDHGSPVILTIKQPYMTDLIKIFPEAQSGLCLFGGGYFGDHDWDYNVYTSTGSNPRTNDLSGLEDLSGGGKVNLHLDMPVDARFGVSGYSGLERHTTLIAKADRSFLLSDFLTNGAPDPSKFAILGQVGDDEYFYENTVDIQDRQLALGADFRLEYQGMILQGEYNQRTVTNELASSNNEGFFNGFYILAAYRHQAKEWLALTPYLMYEGIGWEKAEQTKSESTYGYLPMEGFDVYQAGLNVGLFGNVYWKLEYSMATIRKLDAPPSFPTFKNKYSDSDLNISTLWSQLAIAF